MEHERVVPVLSDLLAGRLAPHEASESWTHVAACPECQGTLGAMHELRRAVAARGVALFEAHPSSQEIVRYAAEEDGLSLQNLAEIGLHVRECPECSREVDLTRRADAATRDTASGSPSRLGARFSGFRDFRIERLWPVLAPSLAVALVLFAYPAYLGMAVLPRSERERENAARELASARTRESTLRAELESARGSPGPASDWGGGIRLLFLGGSKRGAQGLPRVVLQPGQPYQPIAIDFDLAAESRRRPPPEVEVVVRHVPAGEVAWRHQAPASELWDPANQAVVVLVPAAKLTPAEYRLELRRSAEREPAYVARFLVSAP